VDLSTWLILESCAGLALGHARAARGSVNLVDPDQLAGLATCPALGIVELRAELSTWLILASSQA